MKKTFFFGGILLTALFFGFFMVNQARSFDKLFSFSKNQLLAPASNCGEGVKECVCGDTLIADYTLTQNLNCTGRGLIMGADNITLDCNGHTLSYVGSYGGTINPGVSTFTGYVAHQGTTIKNCNIQNFVMGIRIWKGSHYTKVIGNTITGSKLDAVQIDSQESTSTSSHYLEFIGNTISDNDQNGLFLMYSNNNIVHNNQINNNGLTGLTIWGGANNNVQNNTIQNNGAHAEIQPESVMVGWDLYMRSWIPEHSCSQTIINNIGSGGRPILFSNQEIHLIAGDYSEIILCNADYSTLENVNVRGADSFRNNGIIILDTDHATFTNIDSSHNAYGLFIEDSYYNEITDSTFDSNNHGISGYEINYFMIYDNYFRNNIYGMKIGQSRGNYIFNNYLYGNSNVGLRLDNANTPYNKVWNNLFLSNALNANEISVHTTRNYWDNDGVGNMWDDYSGVGVYEIPGPGTGVDHYPKKVTSQIECGIEAYTDVYMSHDLSNCPGVGINVAADDIIIDCNGFTLGGDNSPLHYGINLDNRNNVEIRNCNIQDFDGGVSITNSQNIDLLDSTITNAPFRGINLKDSEFINILRNNMESASGMRIDNVHFSSFNENEFYEVTTAFELWTANENDFYDNVIDYAGKGFQLSQSDWNQISGNTANDITYNGLSLLNSRDNIIWGNYFYNCGWGSAYEDSASLGNSWYNGLTGNYYSDFASNPGYPDYYLVPGPGDGIDYYPIWNKPPVLSPVGDKEVMETETLIIQLSAADPDNDILTYWTDAYLQLPSSYYFDELTGSFEWTPGLGDAGIYQVMFSVTDGEFTDSEEILIEVTEKPAQANCGDTITEDFTLHNDLLSCPGHGLVIGADNIVLDCNGHKIRGNYSSGTKHGIYLADKTGVTVKNCVIEEFYRSGLKIEGGQSHTIEGNQFNQRLSFGLWVADSAGHHLIDNLITDTGDTGIYLLNSSNTTVSQNTVAKGYNFGIYLSGGAFNEVSGNTVTNISSFAGIRLYNSDNNEIFENTVDSTNPPHDRSDYGLSLMGSENNRLHGNNIYRSGANGINLNNTSLNNTVFDNNLQDNLKWDIYIAACKNSVTGNIGSAGRPIGFINSTTTLTGGLYSELILCGAHNSNISGVTVRGSETVKNNGLLVVNTNGAIFSGLDSSGNYYGLSLFSSNYNTIQNSVFADNDNDIPHGAGFYASNSHYNIFKNNWLNNNTRGSWLHSSTYNQLLENIFEGNQEGIFSYHGKNNHYEENIFKGNSIGLSLGLSSDDNLINDNFFWENNRGLYGFSIINNNFIDNEFKDNQYGFHLYSGNYNLLTGNTFRDNSQYGFYINYADYSNYFKNWFYGNGVHAYESDWSNGNNWDVDGIGNYWDDYSGAGVYEIPGPGLGVDNFPIWDADGDGYYNFEDCDDNNPAVNPGAEEICDGIDNNCDGIIDGIFRSCGVSSVGMCRLGSELCTNGVWGECVGAVYPTKEICDGQDNDCDGVIDNDCYEPRQTKLRPISEF